MIYITECPRDAMQGIHQQIPTDLKARYINQLLKVGFEKIDFGSFVSPKAIPQMRDTAEVLSLLDLSATSSRLLAIIANARGAEDAAQFEEISYLGFPFSISETFQKEIQTVRFRNHWQGLKKFKVSARKAIKNYWSTFPWLLEIHTATIGLLKLP